MPQDLPENAPARSIRSVNFTNDSTFIYTSYFADFGPLDLGITYQFCKNLQETMNQAKESRKYVLFYAGSHDHKKANSAVCLCAYLVFVLDFSIERAYRPFIGGFFLSYDFTVWKLIFIIGIIGMNPPFVPFRDAGFCINTYPITVLDTLKAFRKARNLGHFNYKTFSLLAYQNMSKLQNGDMSWIIPGKFIAFSGPQAK